MSIGCRVFIFSHPQEALEQNPGSFSGLPGGFSLDFYADRDLDAEGPRAEIRHNPLTDGSLSPPTGLAFSITFIAISFATTLLIASWALLPCSIVLVIIVGLALHLFERPLTRALTLGLLQGLYLIMGAASGQPSLGLGLLAGMFFLAMIGGREMINIRDFPQDKATRVQTLPKRYEVRRSLQCGYSILATTKQNNA